MTLQMGHNQMKTILNVTGMTSLTRLNLDNNLIESAEPLLNMGLSKQHAVSLKSNPLDTASTSTHIPKMQRAGVTIDWSIAPAASTIAAFKDANIESAIRSALSRTEGTIFVAELDKLTSLTIRVRECDRPWRHRELHPAD